MKPDRRFLIGMAGWVVCAVVAFNVEAGTGRRVDPNAVDKVPSPFHGTVAGVSATTVTVKGEVKGKGTQPPSGEPRTAPGEKPKEISVPHTVTFFIKPDIKVTRDGKASQLKDVHPGDSVSVTFTTKEGSSVKHVTEVAVGTAPADGQDPPKTDKKAKKK